MSSGEVCLLGAWRQPYSHVVLCHLQASWSPEVIFSFSLPHTPMHCLLVSLIFCHFFFFLSETNSHTSLHFPHQCLLILKTPKAKLFTNNKNMSVTGIAVVTQHKVLGNFNILFQSLYLCLDHFDSTFQYINQAEDKQLIQTIKAALQEAWPCMDTVFIHRSAGWQHQKPTDSDECEPDPCNSRGPLYVGVSPRKFMSMRNDIHVCWCTAGGVEQQNLFPFWILW